MKRLIVLGNFILTLLLSLSAKSQISYEDAFPNISFNFPVEIQNAGDSSNRLFVVEQPGVIKVFPNNTAITPADVKTFLDIRSRVSYSAGAEIGLLGLAFHPNYEQNGFLYVYYTSESAGFRMTLSRFQASALDADFVDPSSETVIFSFQKNQSESNHNGGKIAFGPDGYLYVSIGDGGGAGDPQRNAQNLNTAFGSILRIDVDVDGNNPLETNPEEPNGNYEIPIDNPRVGQSGLDELYAWGFRNTWKFSFDDTTMWGADVGQGSTEEINVITIGNNYGWNRFEGNNFYDASSPLVTEPDTKPIFTYGHSNGDVSITGGYVYRGSSQDPRLQGKYIYGDFVSGRVWSLTYDANTGSANSDFLFRTNGQFISSFGLDEFGEIYFSDYGNDVKIYTIDDGNTGPVTTPINGVGSWINSGVPGLNGIVEAITQDGNGNIYAGGEFSNASGINVSNLAVYNKELGWLPFGSGTNGKVSALALDNNGNIYVGGNFSSIDGVPVSNIAFWNGSTWSAMNGGTNGPVSKVGVDANGNVYIGGAFETAGGVTVNNIALWQSGAWSALQDITTGSIGTNNEIRSIAFDENDNLYIGGNFTNAGGNNAPRIATWNGSNWDTLGDGTSGFVQAILVRPDYIYAGGNFSIAGSETVNRIARWNRNTLVWEPLDFGLSGNVNTLSHDGTYLYVGGAFETASDQIDINKIVSNLARWSESNGWEALGTNTNVGVNNVVNKILIDTVTSELYIGGSFEEAGAIDAENIAIWKSGDGCQEFSITPEYTINGVTDSGSNSVTVIEGATFSLGITQELFFTTTLPNGSFTTGISDFGSISQNQSGTYLFTTTEGCTEVFELMVIEDPNGDSDNDGILNADDDCPDTPNGETVDENGCSPFQLDDDEDGVPNPLDQCPETPLGETVDGNGCGSSQLDDDNDGVSNAIDVCPNTPTSEIADDVGCGPSQQDIDNDGVPNSQDLCNDTPQGESVDANGCSESQRDDDQDGVPNAFDRCPATPNGASVDSEGCVISDVPNDNFRITSVSATCRASRDGQITINSELALTFVARLTGVSFSETRNFVNNLIIDELPSGSYGLCITTAEYPDFEMCSTIVVDAPEPLSVVSDLSVVDSMINLVMQGGDQFLVTINENSFITSSNTLDLKLSKGENKLKVTTDKECQGVFEQTFFIEETPVFYPNPFSNIIFLNTQNYSEGDLSIFIYNAAGQLIKEIDSVSVKGESEVILDLAELATGLYLAKLKGERFERTVKLVKQ